MNRWLPWLAAGGLLGCAGGPGLTPAMHRAEVVRAAHFDTGCAPERIDVRIEDDRSFKVDACGAERRYHRIGSMYYATSPDDPSGG